MKMKRKLILLCLLLFVGVMYAEAQRGQRGQRPDPKEQANNTADTWQEEFGLSDEQRTKVYDLLLETSEQRMEKMQELRASGDREGMRDAIMEIQEEMEEKLKKILTDTQWPLYEKWKKENPPRGRRGGGGQ